MNLKFYKMYDDGISPKFETEGSACFDITANFISPRSDRPAQLITVYNMSNQKEHREVKMWALKNSKFGTGIELYPGERVLIPTGLIFDIPEGYSVRLHTRSSVSLKRGLTMPNGEGIIDSDYYHQTYVMLYNASADEVRIYHGDRIAQGELVEKYDYSLTETKDIPEQKTTRVGGFGSTGV
jgi:dUTP pyrophosphatase